MFLRNAREFYQITRLCIPEDRTLDSYHFENFKYHKDTVPNIYFFQESMPSQFYVISLGGKCYSMHFRVSNS